MLTVSIVTHRTPPTQLNNALTCLLRSEAAQIYIVDNSPDNSLSDTILRDRRIIYMHVENKGYGAGHNMAIREVLSRQDIARCGFHLVMNADVCWEGDVLKPLLRYLGENPDVGMVMPKVYYPDGALQYTCRMLPSPADLFLKRFMPASLVRRRMERYLLAEHDHDVPLNSPYLLGSFLLFRNEALIDCGLFDERFFMYPEDIDITRRIHLRWRTMYWPGTSIIHEHAAASRKNKKMLKIHISNMILYFNKWGWIIDRQRRQLNRKLRESITFIPPSRRPEARG